MNNKDTLDVFFENTSLLIILLSLQNVYIGNIMRPIIINITTINGIIPINISILKFVFTVNLMLNLKLKLLFKYTNTYLLNLIIYIFGKDSLINLIRNSILLSFVYPIIGNTLLVILIVALFLIRFIIIFINYYISFIIIPIIITLLINLIYFKIILLING